MSPEILFYRVMVGNLLREKTGGRSSAADFAVAAAAEINLDGQAGGDNRKDPSTERAKYPKRMLTELSLYLSSWYYACTRIPNKSVGNVLFDKMSTTGRNYRLLNKCTVKNLLLTSV